VVDPFRESITRSSIKDDWGIGMGASTNVSVDLEEKLVVARDVVGLHEGVSAASQDVATGVTRPGVDGARADGAAAIRSGAMRGGVRAFDGKSLGCGRQCAKACIENLADEVKGAFSGLPHVVAHSK